MAMGAEAVGSYIQDGDANVHEQGVKLDDQL